MPNVNWTGRGESGGTGWRLIAGQICQLILTLICTASLTKRSISLCRALYTDPKAKIFVTVTTLLHQLLFFSEQKYYHWVSDKIAAVYTSLVHLMRLSQQKSMAHFSVVRTSTSASKLGL